MIQGNLIDMGTRLKQHWRFVLSHLAIKQTLSTTHSYPTFATENMLDLINIKPEIEDAPDALPLSLSQSRHGCSIEFRNVNFSYNPERKILHNVSFKLKPGRLLGIVGGSGR